MSDIKTGNLHLICNPILCTPTDYRHMIIPNTHMCTLLLSMPIIYSCIFMFTNLTLHAVQLCTFTLYVENRIIIYTLSASPLSLPLLPSPLSLFPTFSLPPSPLLSLSLFLSLSFPPPLSLPLSLSPPLSLILVTLMRLVLL